MAAYLPYPRYKSSGNSWLGDMPEHWTPRRSDFVIDTNRQQVSAESLNGAEVIHYSIPNVQEYGAGVLESGDKVDSAKLLISEEQLLVSKLNPRKATLCIAKPDEAYRVIASSEFVPILSAKANLRYAYYVWGSDKVTKLLSSMVQSVTRSHQRVNPSDILKLHWAWPTQQEQQAIARFLDFKTSQIDALIAKKKSLIDKLAEKRTALISHAVTKGLDPSVPMKDSKAAWLGHIPRHWEAKRLKFVISEPIKYGANEAAELTDPELPRYIRITDVNDDGSLRDETFRSLPEEIADGYLLSDGDILLARSGATVGKSFIYKPSWGVAAYAGYLIRARMSEAVNADFAYLFLQSSCYWQWLSSVFIQATIQNVSAEKYANLVIPVPPVKEQLSIVTRLLTQLKRIDAQRERANLAVERLIEYRSALITNAVTGKIDVRDVPICQPPEA